MPRSRPTVERGWTSSMRWAPVWVLVAGIVGYLMAVPAGLVDQEHRLGVPEIALLTVLLLGAVLSAQVGYSITDVSLGGSGVTARFERLQIRQDSLESDVRALVVAVTGLVTKFEAVHLEKLSREEPAVVRFGNIMLEELTHLDAVSFVRPKDVRGLNAMREDRGDGLQDFDLKDYIEITQEGREYLSLRARLAARIAEADAERQR